MSDDPENKSLVQITDLFGLSRSADRLVAAIERGVGKLLGPLQKTRETKADISAFKNWNVALKKAGMRPTAADLTIEDRAVVRLFAEEVRHQENREAIALQAANEYRHTLSDMPEIPTAAPVGGNGWLDRFWRLAQDVTDADMQAVWGRVLARQTSGVSKHSARCLEALSMLSREEAQFLEHLATVTSTTIVNGRPDHYVVTRVHLREHSDVKREREL